MRTQRICCIMKNAVLIMNTMKEWKKAIKILKWKRINCNSFTSNRKCNCRIILYTLLNWIRYELNKVILDEYLIDDSRILLFFSNNFFSFKRSNYDMIILTWHLFAQWGMQKFDGCFICFRWHWILQPYFYIAQGLLLHIYSRRKNSDFIFIDQYNNQYHV